jgi:putative addiction module CopG family antidote
MQVHIPGHLKEFIEREVRIGHYPDEDAVIADALERLADEENDTRMTVEEAVAESLAQMERGEGRELTEEVWQEILIASEEDSLRGIPISDDVKY